MTMEELFIRLLYEEWDGKIYSVHPVSQEEADPQLHWKGSANQRVIDVKATKKSGEVVLHCA